MVRRRQFSAAKEVIPQRALSSLIYDSGAPGPLSCARVSGGQRRGRIPASARGAGFLRPLAGPGDAESDQNRRPEAQIAVPRLNSVLRGSIRRPEAQFGAPRLNSPSRGSESASRGSNRRPEAQNRRPEAQNRRPEASRGSESSGRTLGGLGWSSGGLGWSWVVLGGLGWSWGSGGPRERWVDSGLKLAHFGFPRFYFKDLNKLLDLECYNRNCDVSNTIRILLLTPWILL